MVIEVASEALPKNDRSDQILARRAAEEEQKQLKAEQERAAKDKEDKARKQRERDAQKMMKEKEKMAAVYAAKRAEEEEQSKKLGGAIRQVLFKLSENETPGEFSMSGIELGGARIRILVSQLAYNESLKCMHLARADIKDEDGVEIAKILYNNKCLKKLELEGNCLGPNTAKTLGKALRVNKTLQFLDLESN